MRGTDTTIIRRDGDNYPLSLCVETGRVERQNTFYASSLKGETARGLFLSLVGITYSNEVQALIRACNRVAARRGLKADDDRLDAVRVLLGLDLKLVRAAKPHPGNCRCPRCVRQHAENGCSRNFCPVCG
jgi:hypothetical protein